MEQINLSEVNAINIQQLHKNVETLDTNLHTIFDEIKDATRDTYAIQRAFLLFLQEKGLIESDEDKDLFKKLYIRSLAQIDQEVAAKRLGS